MMQNYLMQSLVIYSLVFYSKMNRLKSSQKRLLKLLVLCDKYRHNRSGSAWSDFRNDCRLQRKQEKNFLKQRFAWSLSSGMFLDTFVLAELFGLIYLRKNLLFPFSGFLWFHVSWCDLGRKHGFRFQSRICLWIYRKLYSFCAFTCLRLIVRQDRD